MTESPATPDGTELRTRVLTALAGVFDPELGIDVVSLGLVLDVRSTGDGVEIDMTLTTPGCPVSEQLPLEAGQAAQDALDGTPVTVNVRWDTPWTPDRISTRALEELGITRHR